MELSLSDFNYRRWKAKQEYADTLENLKDEKNADSARLDAKRVYELELGKIDKEEKADEQARQMDFNNWLRTATDQQAKEQLDAIHKTEEEKKAAVRWEKENYRELLRTIKSYEDDIKSITADEYHYKLFKENEWYRGEKERLRIDLQSERITREQYNAALEKLEADHQARLKQIRAQGFVFYLMQATSAIKSVASLFSQYYAQEQTNLDNWYKTRQDYINANISDETKRSNMLAALDEEYQNKSRAIKRKAAVAEKASNIASVIENTAVAVMKMWGQLGIFGAIMTGFVIALGAAQVALILRQPLPLAQGGLVEARAGGTPAILAEGGVSEAVVPLPELKKMVGPGGGATNITFQINAADASSFDAYFFKKLLPKMKRALQSERIVIPANAVGG